MNYPFELLRREATAVTRRRDRAQGKRSTAIADALPKETVGLALSGGGIRCATFSLGILQALAKLNRLRFIDFLSTVSGGSYAGSFLGRLFTRTAVRDEQQDPCGRVENILANSNSAQMQWLRSHANYIISAGNSDVRDNLAVFWRNLVSIYFILGILGFAAFGILRVVGDAIYHVLRHAGWPASDIRQSVSGWWWLPLAALLLGFLPGSLAYWLAPKAGTRAHFSFAPLVAWLVLLLALAISLKMGAVTLGFGTIAVALVAILWLEVARSNLPPALDRSTGETSADPGLVIRNRLTRGLGETLIIFVVALGWVLIDTLAGAFARGTLWKIITAWGLVLMPALPFFKRTAQKLSRAHDGQNGTPHPLQRIPVAIIAFLVVGFVMVVLDGSVHWVFDHQPIWTAWSLMLASVLSIALGRAFDFLNYSSLQQTYAARLSRTFLGASNPARFRAAPHEIGRDVQVVHPDDDVPFDMYHPEESGGPLHLIGLCVNETVDAASQREIRDRKGLSMCVGPCGVSVGRKFHSIWTRPPERMPFRLRFRRWLTGEDHVSLNRSTALRAIPVSGEVFHVLKGKTNWPTVVEALGLGTWTAISGAAFGTGTGRFTSLPMALLLGLVNLRLGYWWDSGLKLSDRPGRYRTNLWRTLKRFPAFFVEMQSLLLSDFRGRFGGPSYRFWNISDGGHFDLTGIYELIRRRLPFIIAVDGGEDRNLTFADMGDLVRQIRIDFNAGVEFLSDPKVLFGTSTAGVPTWIAKWLQADALGSPSEIGQKQGKHAALARVTYGDDLDAITWIVLLKASLTDDEPLDVHAYKRMHPDFPAEATVDQFFDEAQWESYRMLGEHVGLRVLARQS